MLLMVTAPRSFGASCSCAGPIANSKVRFLVSRTYGLFPFLPLYLHLRYRELQQRLREETVSAAAAAAGQQREAAEAEKYKREAEAVHRQLRQQQRHQQQLQEELRSCRALLLENTKRQTPAAANATDRQGQVAIVFSCT